MIPALLAAAVTLSHARDLDPRWRPDPKDTARFEFLRARKRERDGYLPYADLKEDGPLRPAPEGHWERREKERAAAFDRRFGSGAYAGIVSFFDECKAIEGCPYLATADVFKEAYAFEGPPDAKRAAELAARLRRAVKALRPKKDAPKAYHEAFARFSAPLLKP